MKLPPRSAEVRLHFDLSTVSLIFLLDIQTISLFSCFHNFPVYFWPGFYYKMSSRKRECGAEAKMTLTAADFTDALWGINQAMLDNTPELADAHKMQGAAYLKLGALHGVTVELESALDETGDVPPLVRQGLVIRCLIPRGTDIEAMRLSLEGGTLARLIQAVLKGHQLELTPEGGTGRLSRGAARAREQLLSALANLSPASAAPVLAWPLPRPGHVAAPEMVLHH
ncbi:hypothetical protein QMO56_10965 [Roseomonas sp. E05]|uniref:hypothetical protein n=1 Tax=Roseomonas sp. E05 TaxID=3046310 RepID=UPI0024BA0B42|nr:hypothetical protein [Roseomonas sp. E05]MDJ0388632.1 hypothetical protein [Roseomonas sp. E05]